MLRNLYLGYSSQRARSTLTHFPLGLFACFFHLFILTEHKLIAGKKLFKAAVDEPTCPPYQTFSKMEKVKLLDQGKNRQQYQNT